MLEGSVSACGHAVETIEGAGCPPLLAGKDERWEAQPAVAPVAVESKSHDVHTCRGPVAAESNAQDAHTCRGPCACERRRLAGVDVHVCIHTHVHTCAAVATAAAAGAHQRSDDQQRHALQLWVLEELPGGRGREGEGGMHMREELHGRRGSHAASAQMHGRQA
eukprot:356909-Chlamydomonas_euryale.AAC.1